MGAGEFLGASAVLSTVSGIETNSANKKLAKQQLKAAQEAQSEANQAQKDAIAERKKKIDTATVKLNKLPLPPELSDLTTPDLPGYPHAELLTMDGDNLILDIGAISLSGIFGRSKGIYSYNVKDQKLVTLKDLSEEENRVKEWRDSYLLEYFETIDEKFKKKYK